MHLYIMTRGIKQLIDEYINDLQAQYFPYGNPPNLLQLSVRPLQLWELVFPKEQLKEVMQTVLPYESIKSWGLKDIRKHKLALLRLALGAKKIPKLDLTQGIVRPLRKENIAIYPIGIKEDNIWKEGPFKDLEQI